MAQASQAFRRLHKRRQELSEFTRRLDKAITEAREQDPPTDQVAVIRRVLEEMGLTDAD